VTISKSLVLETLDLDVSVELVGPLHEVILSLRTNDLQVVESDELPNNCNDLFFISFIEIITTDTWNFKS